MPDSDPSPPPAIPETGAGAGAPEPSANSPPPPPPPPRRQRRGFGEDFQRFFLRGLGTLLPTIITIALIWYVIDVLWEAIGQYIIEFIKWTWATLVSWDLVDVRNATYIRNYWQEDEWYTKFVGVALALLAIYLIGLLVGNFIGRAFYRLAERLVMRVPVVRALYPAVKQVTDFLLNDKEAQFSGSRVVAVQPHAGGIWSVALVTGNGLPPLTEKTAQEMVTVFVPSSPTAFSGYVMIAPRSSVVELPMTVEEAMRLLVSGGVIMPKPPRAEGVKKKAPWRKSAPAASAETGETAGATGRGEAGGEPSPSLSPPEVHA